jgi:hypothetical protein
MSAQIPKDIESCEQWQLRYEGLSGNEVVKTGTESQMRWLAKSKREFGAVLERRTITVGAWEAVDIDAPASNALETSDD